MLIDITEVNGLCYIALLSLNKLINHLFFV